MGGRAKLVIALVGEDVHASDVGLGVTVLASLRGGHVENLAGVALEKDNTTLAKSRALRGDDESRVRITVISHCKDLKTREGLNVN